ncbi:MAG: DegV family protein [Caldisericia bacterium]|jgi:DegV family protein with EDD domain|nr:DegV family protein [Caldisericia bacterium]
MIKVVIDSGCDLPEEYLKEKDIRVIPLYLKLDDKFLRDGIDIKPQEFFELLKKNKNINTSQPPIEDFIKVYKDIINEGNEVISIHITGKGSGTVSSAKIAREEVDRDKIDVLDSNHISASYGFIVKRIQELIDKGFSRNEILKRFTEIINKVQLFFTLNTLEYVYKGGRVNEIKAIFSNILDVKPILIMKDGLPKIYKLIRGRRNSLKELIKIVIEYLKNVKNFEIAFVHGDASLEINLVKEEILKVLKPKYFFTKLINSALGVHAGPGSLGVAINLIEEEL